MRNHLDLITAIPPGLGDNESGRNALSSASVLNFAWLGAAVRLRPAGFPFRRPFYSLERLGAFHEAVEVRVDDVNAAEAEAEKGLPPPSLKPNPLVFAMSLLPAPLYNHRAALFFCVHCSSPR